MAIFSWRAKKQFFYFGIFAVVIFSLTIGIIWFFSSKANCTDGVKNQGEEEVDCGGPCANPCLGEVKELTVSWVRFFKSREGFYDAAALIENKNLFAGLPAVKYRFKIYDANDILIAIQEGNAFINPNGKKIIFESSIPTGPRAPRYIYIEFDKEKNWKYIKKGEVLLSIAKKDFINNPFPRLTADIRNISSSDVKDVFVSAVLYDEEENTRGVSFTKIDSIAADSAQTASFTWPQPLDKNPAVIEVFAETDLTE